MTSAKLLRFVLVTGLSASALSSFAQTPLFACPVQWDRFTTLRPEYLGSLDSVVGGVRIRDWQPEHLDLALRRFDECLATKPGPQSLKDAEHKFAADNVRAMKAGLVERDRRMAEEKAAIGIQQSAAQVGSPRIGTNATGAVQWRWRYAGESATRVITCTEPGAVPLYVTTLSSDSLQDLPKFVQACMRAGQMSPEVAGKFKVAMDKIASGAPTDADFIAKVAALRGNPTAQTHKALLALEDLPQYEPSPHPPVLEASSQVRRIREALDARECPALTTRAGVPKELAEALYVWKLGDPTGFTFIPCDAIRSGATFAFSPKGLVSKDSFEIRSSARVVKVTMMRNVASDGRSVLLSPVEAQINGGRVASITNENLPQLTDQLRQAIRNH
jgi:hypothetical protein